MNVLKRDGRRVEFNPERIRKSINAARSACYVDDLFLVDEVTAEVSVRCYDGIHTSDIHEMVIQELYNYGALEIAERFDIVREQRTKARGEKCDSCTINNPKLESAL